MRAITLSLGAVAILLISSNPCFGQDSDGFHSYANLSDTDKIGLVIQRLNRAIESKDADGVVKCLSVALKSDTLHADSVKTRFETLFQRIDAVLSAIGGKGAGESRSDADPVFHLSQPKPAMIDPDTAALAQPLYLGSNPAHYSDTVQLCLSSWLGMYGITNALDLAANMENVLNEAIENPELLAAEAAVARPVAKSMRTSTDLPHMLIHKQFRGGGVWPTEVFHKNYANQTFDGKDLFGRPYDVTETVIHTLGADHWGMLATDANWDRYICFGKKGTEEFVSGGEHYGQANSAFRFPAGVSLLTDQDLYICDAYHNKVARYSVNFVGCNSQNQPTVDSNLSFNYSDFNFPVDVDAAHIPNYEDFDCTFHNWVAICDQGNDRIVVTGIQGGWNFALGHGEPAGLYLNQPTSIAFARENQVGWPRNEIYIVDAGNTRVVKCISGSIYGDYTYYIASDDTVFADNAYLTSVDVDPFGQVYVLDSYNGTIYKFDEDLQFIGKWGSLGADQNHLYYPSRLSNARGWHDAIDTLCEDNPILYPTRLGDILVTELYSATTGIKRFKIGNDLLSSEAGYHYRSPNNVDDFIYVEWDQADYGYAGVSVNGPCVNDNIWGFYSPGLHSQSWLLPYLAPSQATYNVALILYSAYDTSMAIAARSYSVSTDRDTCNWPPIITYWPNLLNNDNEDSCVVYGMSYMCAVDICDIDDESHVYTWTSPVGRFFFDSDPIHFYDSLSVIDLKRVKIIIDFNKDALDKLREIFRVTIRDDQGGMTMGACEKKIHNSTDECIYYPPPPACPVLYYYNQGEWRLVNNLLAESETAIGLRSNVAEIYPVPDANADQSGRLRMRITEEADEVTSLKSLRAVQITYPDTLALIMANGDRPFALADNDILPTLAYTAAGDTVTGMIRQTDGTSFSDVSPGSLFVEYVFDSSQGGYSKPLTWAPGGPRLPDPTKAIPKRMVTPQTRPSHFYEIFARNESGGWVSVAKSFPRLVTTGQYFELSEYIVGNKLSLRIDYRDSIAVDYLPFHIYQPVTVTPRPMQLVSAAHNGGEDVTSRLANGRGAEVVVKRGESLDLVFQGTAPSPGYKQMVLFASQGRYEKTSDFDARSHGITFDQNYPNPFNPTTSFRYYLPEAGKVKLEIYNVLGQKVIVLADGLQAAGEHVVAWDSRDGHGDPVANGVYFARFTAGEYTVTKKLEVLK